MRTATRALLALTLATPFLPLVAGLWSAALDYRGVCPGFTDGEAPCRFVDYALTEAAFSLVFAPALLALLLLGWLVVLLRRLRR
jgi:hypothetical protein